MEIKLTQMESLKKEKKLVVNFLIFLFFGAISSCTSLKYQKNDEFDPPSKNCIKYTLNYSTKLDSLTLDTIFVSGKTRECTSNKILSGVEITVYDENKKEITKVSSDRKGKFSFKIEPGYYYLIAESSPNSLQLPITYFGHFGNILEMNMYLGTFRYPSMINELNDPGLRKEVEQLKKRLKKEQKKKEKEERNE